MTSDRTCAQSGGFVAKLAVPFALMDLCSRVELLPHSLLLIAIVPRHRSGSCSASSRVLYFALLVRAKFCSCARLQPLVQRLYKVRPLRAIEIKCLNVYIRP